MPSKTWWPKTCSCESYLLLTSICKNYHLLKNYSPWYKSIHTYTYMCARACAHIHMCYDTRFARGDDRRFACNYDALRVIMKHASGMEKKYNSLNDTCFVCARWNDLSKLRVLRAWEEKYFVQMGGSLHVKGIYFIIQITCVSFI